MPALAQSVLNGRVAAPSALRGGSKARAGSARVVRRAAYAQQGPLMPPANNGKTVESVGVNPVYEIAAAKGADGARGRRQILSPTGPRAESGKTRGPGRCSGDRCSEGCDPEPRRT